MIKKLFLLTLFLSATLAAVAQTIAGVVIDEQTDEALPFVNVTREGSRPVQTDLEGRFSLPFRQGKLRFSMIGYETKTVNVREAGRLEVRLRPSDNEMREAVVTGRRERYSRKNNPAVELMRRVIAAKTRSDLTAHDFYSIDKYSKLTFALNEVTDKVFEEGSFKRMPFLKEHVEVCNETGKLILPISVDETASREIYRCSTGTTKTIVTGRRNNGLNELLNTGDIMTTMLADCFTDVNIYDDEVRLLQYPFVSPISSRSAISFYRYYIEDTLMVDDTRCIRVDFTPNNPQDFGFSGSLYIMADSTYRVKMADIGIPARSDVNFVERMRIIQRFAALPTGEQALVKDDMLVQLKITNKAQKFQVRRTTEYSNFSFEPLADVLFDFKGNEMTDPNALMRDQAFWQQHRSEQLSTSEDKMDLLMRRIEQVKGFKAILFVAKALIENFVETSVDPKHPSKVDIGPVNTMISQNFIDGLRLRASAQTTANLSPHFFLKGYVAYGFKDQRWKGMLEATYSFNKKAYLPREYPVNNLTLTYNRDVMAPSDKFMPTDKDNVFTSFKWTKVDHVMYYETFRLMWDREWANGLRFMAQLRTQKDEPTGALFYQSLNGNGAPTQEPQSYRRELRTNDLTLRLSYQPGTTWINTKQRRIAANNDAPIYSLSHTAGLYEHMGRNYTYNITEAALYKRFWLNSWGKIDAYVQGGAQWNRVPFPLLIMPAANLSYIIEDHTFNLINNMEFLNDRYASLMLSWDMNGKIFNRIPLIKKLKWREYIGCNVLWGTLTSKNDPFLSNNASDNRLYYFPGTFREDGSFEYLSTKMDPKIPYVEVIAGIHNIFKVFHIQYVRRLTYLDRPDTDRWGIRFMFRVTF